MTRSLTYETKTCGRCGGSGRYSYCAMYGSTCFSCRGAKKLLSKAGAKAHTAMNAFMLERFGKLGADLAVGDQVFLNGKYRTVVEIDENGGTGSSTTTRDGVTVTTTHQYRMLTLKNGSGYGVLTAERYTVRPKTTTEFDEVFAYAATLKGVTVTTSDSQKVA